MNVGSSNKSQHYHLSPQPFSDGRAKKFRRGARPAITAPEVWEALGRSLGGGRVTAIDPSNPSEPVVDPEKELPSVFFVVLRQEPTIGSSRAAAIGADTGPVGRVRKVIHLEQHAQSGKR